MTCLAPAGRSAARARRGQSRSPPAGPRLASRRDPAGSRGFRSGSTAAPHSPSSPARGPLVGRRHAPGRGCGAGLAGCAGRRGGPPRRSRARERTGSATPPARASWPFGRAPVHAGSPDLPLGGDGMIIHPRLRSVVPDELMEQAAAPTVLPERQPGPKAGSRRGGMRALPRTRRPEPRGGRGADGRTPPPPMPIATTPQTKSGTARPPGNRMPRSVVMRGTQRGHPRDRHPGRRHDGR
jgi:hypothetical protein